MWYLTKDVAQSVTKVNAVLYKDDEVIIDGGLYWFLQSFTLLHAPTIHL